jgi:predicted transglutaminase-like cysteine proteinase
MVSTWTYRLALVTILLVAIGAESNASDSQLSPFMVTRGKTSQPIGHYEFCLRYRDECAVKSPSEERVQLTGERWNELVAVNNEVNVSIKPATDMEVYGRAEYWAYPVDRGDCEDYVLLKRRILIGKGWPTGSLLITVVRQRNGDGHAVLTVLTDRGDLVLDNREAHVLVWSETGYQYLKRQSEFDSGAWVAIEDGHPTAEVGSLNN